MLVWNSLTTWWMWNSTDVGAAAAIITNSLLMTFPWWGYFICKQQYSNRIALFALVIFWLGFEYVHLNWELSWPWLTLGNVFANMPDQIQWYEYTGVGGGSLLVWIMNILALQLVQLLVRKQPFKMIRNYAFLFVAIPAALSLLSYFIKINVNTPAATKNVVVVQPNIDPYQKFELSTAAEQINHLLALSAAAADSNTQLIIWPETAMSVADWQDQIAQNSYYQPIFDFARNHPWLAIVSGIETFKNYGSTKATPTAHSRNDGIFYDAFNAAIRIQDSTDFEFYNKSKLVPGVESLPSFLRIFAPFFEQFGGSTGGYGKSEEAGIFSIRQSDYVAAPIICYESIYGEYVGSYVKKGATILTILTNDGWWGNTPGHKQHLAYAKLRAIETRRWVARSANTGISAVINEYGEIVQQEPWDKSATIRYAIPSHHELSFYVKHGDYIFQLCFYLGLILAGYHSFSTVRKKLVNKQLWKTK